MGILECWISVASCKSTVALPRASKYWPVKGQERRRHRKGRREWEGRGGKGGGGNGTKTFYVSGLKRRALMAAREASVMFVLV